jgi:hypothetical protein
LSICIEYKVWVNSSKFFKTFSIGKSLDVTKQFSVEDHGNVILLIVQSIPEISAIINVPDDPFNVTSPAFLGLGNQKSIIYVNIIFIN